MPEKQDPIFILGAGVFGLSTALAFLEDGFKNVHLFDKNDYPTQGYSWFKGCDSASSDMNKIFRAAYADQVHYQKMALESRDVYMKWNEMIKQENFEGGDPIYINSGNIHLSDQKELPEFERKTLLSMPEHAIELGRPDSVSKAMAKGLQPASVDPFLMKQRGKLLNGILDVTGGTTLADKTCRWVLHLCNKFGSSFKPHFGCPIDHLLFGTDGTKKRCTGFITEAGEVYKSDLVICFLGAWTSQYVKEAGERLEATAGTVSMFEIKDPSLLERFSTKNFPPWTYKVRDGAMGGLYGFPVNGNIMKIGYRGMKFINPQGDVNSVVKTKWTKDSESNVPLFGLTLIKNFVREHIPELDRICATRLCWYSDTVDNDYLISYCPYYGKSLFVAAGDSGHAFMMFGIIGKYVKDIIFEKGDPKLIDLFSWERERENLNAINLGTEDPRALCNVRMATPKDWIINRSSL